MIDFGYYNMDCMDGMKEFPDKYFDLAVVDPPYGIGESGEKNHTDKKYFDELLRVSKNQIIFGANHFISRMPYDSHCWIVWDKDNGETDFADCELAWTSFDTAVRKFKYRWQGMLQENMKNKEFRIHPTQKPKALYDWIFSRYAERGMKFLDTHVGSASSLMAAHDAGLQYVGFEKDKYYYDLSKERLEQHEAQMSLFDFQGVMP